MDEWINEWVVTERFIIWSQRDVHSSYGVVWSWAEPSVWRIARSAINREMPLMLGPDSDPRRNIYVLPSTWEFVK